MNILLKILVNLLFILFGKGYLLATGYCEPYAIPGCTVIDSGIFYGSASSVSGIATAYNMHYGKQLESALRPVVTLNSDVTLEKTTDGNWKIN